MKLGQFREYIESLPNGTLFNYGLSSPFSWRGSYDEVAFEVVKTGLYNREEVLTEINKAYDNTFQGWKGGNFTYDDHTRVNFEREEGSYSDGAYCGEILEHIGSDDTSSLEELLIRSAFKE